MLGLPVSLVPSVLATRAAGPPLPASPSFPSARSKSGLVCRLGGLARFWQPARDHGIVRSRLWLPPLERGRTALIRVSGSVMAASPAAGRADAGQSPAQPNDRRSSATSHPRQQWYTAAGAVPIFVNAGGGRSAGNFQAAWPTPSIEPRAAFARKFMALGTKREGGRTGEFGGRGHWKDRAGWYP